MPCFPALLLLHVINAAMSRLWMEARSVMKRYKSTPQQLVQDVVMYREKEEAKYLKGGFRVAESAIPGGPLRGEYPNRAAYRRAVAKWKRGQGR